MTTAATALQILDEGCTWLRVSAGPPDGPGWFRLDSLGTDAAVDALRAEVRQHSAGDAAVAAAAVVSWVGYAVSWLLLGGALLTRQRPDPAPDQVWVGLHEQDAWIDRIAVATTTPWNDQPQGGQERAVDAMPALVALLGPLVERLAHRRFLGRRTLWGTVADAVSHMTLAAADAGGLDCDTAMRLGDRLVAQLPTRVAPPEWLTVSRAGREQTIRLKQACCLAYKVPRHGWCTSCPLADEVTRAAAIEDWLAAADA